MKLDRLKIKDFNGRDIGEIKFGMTPTQLEAWMKSLDLNKKQASEQLGMSRVTLDGYLNGKRKIPLYIELACEALSLRWKDRA